jgi:FkbM family methyltransferase
MRPKGIVLLSVHGSKMFYDLDVASPLRSLVTLGTYEAFETRVFQSLLRPGAVVVDIGANIGYYTLLAAKAVGPEGLVLAVEPDPRNYELLIRSIEVNGYQNVIPLRMALTDRRGEVTLYADAINAANTSLASGNVQTELCRYTVEAGTLDELVLRYGGGREVNLIKMDVQGAEELVLRGARQVLEAGQAAIMMEFEPAKLEALGADPEQLLNYLRGLGFGIQVLDAERGAICRLNVGEIVDRSRLAGYCNLLVERKTP